MEEITRLMREYAQRHNIEEGVTLHLEKDGGGYVNLWLSASYTNICFDFNSPGEFLERINQ